MQFILALESYLHFLHRYLGHMILRLATDVILRLSLLFMQCILVMEQAVSFCNGKVIYYKQVSNCNLLHSSHL
jgi:hypothetical protein